MVQKSTQKKKRFVFGELFYILKSHKVLVGMVFVLSVVLAFLNMSLPYLLKITIDVVLPSKNFLHLMYMLAAFLGVFAAKNFVYYLSKSRTTMLGEKVAFEVRTNLLEHLHKLSVAFYKRTKPGRISSRLMQDVDSIKNFVQSELIKGLLNVLMLLVAVGIMLKMNVKLAAVALAVLPLHLLVYYLFRGSIRHFSRQAKEHIGSISGDVVEQFSGMETVKASVAEPLEREKFEISMKKGMSAQISQNRYYLLQKISADLLVGVGYALVIAFAGHAVMKDKMQIGSFVAFYSYTRMLYPLVLELVSQAAKFSSTGASFDRVYEIMHTEPEVKERPTARPHIIRHGKVEFEGVSFAYDHEDVIKDVSFCIEPGCHVLVTGPSGAGKTTLLNLIPRFYDPRCGRILIDGKDIKDYTLSALRDQIGVVFQDCFLFNSSVLENIRYARPNASDAEVVKACEMADAHEFITNLPDGYFTLIGEGGIQLSGGQKQRIAIARTILKNPTILILDEALASLDRESSRKVGERLLELARGKTLFTVTHNVDVFTNIDKEIRIRGGRVTVY